jgi:hypothetical protein
LDTSNPSAKERNNERLVAALATFMLLGYAPALAEGVPSQTTPSSSTTKSDQTGLEVACPSRVFDEFLSAFSERVEVQQRYTRLPLQYGDYADLTGNRIKWRRIKKMKDIPTFVRETGLVFRSDSQRADKKLNLRIESGPDERHREAVIFLDGGGYNLRYYFELPDDCWYLYAIKDAY